MPNKDLSVKMLDFIAKKALLSKNQKILLAISGGIDSIVMAHLFSQSQFSFAIAHCNFKLRGKPADNDEAFVKSLAKKIGVAFFSQSFNTSEYAIENKVSIQMAARELRYNWFESLRKENGFHRIATAHHQDDNVETMLLNLVTGTGISGLRGIPLEKNKIIRPLLSITRKEIKNYATFHQIEYREDASNRESKYDRNFIRNEIMPLLRKLNPKLSKTMGGNIQKFQDTEAIYYSGIQSIKKKLLQVRGKEVFIPIKKLLSYAGYQSILYEIIKNYGFSESQLGDIIKSFEGHPGLQFLSPTHRLIKDRDFLIITDIVEEKSEIILIENIKKSVKLEGFKLDFQVVDNKQVNFKNDNSMAYLDYETLKFPLTLRKWKAGDYFYPLGLSKSAGNNKPGKKKISDYLIDKKLSILDKEQTWVVLSNDKLAWLASHRIDHRFRVKPNTKKVLVIKLKSN